MPSSAVGRTAIARLAKLKIRVGIFVHFFVSLRHNRARTGPLRTVAHPHFCCRTARGSSSTPSQTPPTPNSPCLVRLSRHLANRRILDRDPGITSHELTTAAPLYRILRLGFDTMCLHAGYDPHGDESVYGLGQGAPRGVPLHRTAPYQVRFAPMRSSPRSSEGHKFAETRRARRSVSLLALFADRPRSPLI